MSRHNVLVLAFALVLPPAFAAHAQDGDENLIRLADIPKDAPRFEDYPAKPFAGANAAPDVTSDPLSKRYRTQLRSWAGEKPNFAGHYILATWGCGTSCMQIAIIDAISGKVFHPVGARVNTIEDVDADALVDGREGERRNDFGALRYRPDSRLLVLFGTPDGRKENEGISYFVWEHDQLQRVRFVPKGTSPGSK
jgi:hypothetical protein